MRDSNEEEMKAGNTREGDQRQQQRRDGNWQYQGRRPKTATKKRWKLAVPGKTTKDSNKEEMEAGSTREGYQRQQQRRDGSWQYQGRRPKTASKKRWKLAVPGKETKDSNKEEMEAGSTREGDQRQQQEETKSSIREEENEDVITVGKPTTRYNSVDMIPRSGV